LAILPSLCQSFALYQRCKRWAFVADPDAIRQENGHIIFPESG
jgi:hypothetical protein